MNSKINPILELIVNSPYKDYTFWLMYAIVLILSIIAYKLGFAKRLPLLKSIFVYILLVLGTFITTTLSILQFPIAESLMIIVIVLAIYRFRMYWERKQRKAKEK